MVQIGTIEYEARVTGVGDAKANAEDLTESQQQLGEQTRDTAAASSFLAGALGTVAGLEDEVRKEGNEVDEQYTILYGTVIALKGAFTVLSGILTDGVGFGAAAGAAGGLANTLKNLAAGALGGSLAGKLKKWGKGAAKYLRGLAGRLGGILAGALTGSLSLGGIIGGGAAGIALGLGGVKLMQELGLMDALRTGAKRLAGMVPGWLRDGILQILSVSPAGGLAVIGGFVTGFLDDIFTQSLPKSINQGLDRAGKVVDTFVGAWKRQFSRSKRFVTDLLDWVVGTFEDGWGRAKGIVGDAIDGMKEELNTIVGDLRGGFQNATNEAERQFTNLRNRIVFLWDDIRFRINEKVAQIQGDFLGLVTQIGDLFDGVGDDIASAVSGAFNAAVPSTLTVPSVTIGGNDIPGTDEDIPSFTVGGQTIDMPQLQTGGMIQETGVAVVDRGEAVIPEPLVSAARQGGGSSNVTQVDQITVEVSGNFDVSNVSRRDAKRLADTIADELGGATNSSAGVR